MFFPNHCISAQDINRFFVEEGGESDAPKLGFSQPSSNPSTDSQNSKKDESAGDLFEDALEDALCVFKSGGANVDLLKENDK